MARQRASGFEQSESEFSGWLGDSVRALSGAERRVDNALTDFFMAPEGRLSDRHRAQMAQLLRALISAIEDDVRVRLVHRLVRERVRPELSASLGAAHVGIALPLLERSAALRDPDLIAALLRRVDEHRLALALGRDAPHHPAGVAQHLLDLDDVPVARAAMALLIAESRRYDQFGDPHLARCDLPEPLRTRFTWRVAAALRHHMVGRHDMPPVEADLHLSAVVGEILAEVEPVPSLETSAGRLAMVMLERALITDAMLLAAIEEGWLALFAAMLAARAGLEATTVWTMISDPSALMLAASLRAIGCGRAPAITILWRLGSAEGLSEDALGDRADIFDRIGEDEAQDALHIWRLDPEYRQMITRLNGADVARS
jgi:uncharacterized protein (DUF2336 family)